MISFEKVSIKKVKIQVSVDINFETSRKLELEIQAYEISKDVKELEIDLSCVRFIDSTGVSILIKWLHPLTKTIEVSLVGASAPIKNILHICKIDQFVQVQ
jgi:anti-sigma B factor antagonist